MTNRLARIAPGLTSLLSYSFAENFRHDLLAGLSVAAVAPPVAVAYAQLAGFDPAIGLYSSILPLLAYALFGTSRRLIVNPGSVGLPAYTDLEPKHSMEMGAPHARYAVLERRKASEPWQVSFRVVAYDWNGAAERAKAKGREDWAHALRTGYAPP